MSQWYYEYNGSAEGPVSEHDIRRMIDDGTIEFDTGLWCQGMDDWQPAASVDTFSDEFQEPPPLSEDQPYGADPPPIQSASKGSPANDTTGQSAHQGAPDIPSHMTKAILTTLFCCVPLGVVAIVKASSVSSAVRRGDYIEARELSDEANTWGNRAIGFGVAAGVIYFFIALVGSA